MPDSATDPLTRTPPRGLAVKRAAIMEAALDVFVRRGYAATSLEDIATATPVSRQTVYSHFGDKERLFLAVVDQELKATIEGLRVATTAFPDDAADAEEYLLALAQRVISTLLSPRAAALRLLIQSEAPRHPRLFELWRERSAAPVWSAFIGHLARLADEGALTIGDSRRAAGQFVTLITGTVWHMTEFGTFTMSDPGTIDPTELDAAIRANVRLFVRGYRPAP